MEAVYELVLRDEGEKVVVAAEAIDIGDAVAIRDEIWLVLRGSDQAAVRGEARYECRRALRLKNQAQELAAYAREVGLEFTVAREALVLVA